MSDPMTAAVPDPTVEALHKAIKRALAKIGRHKPNLPGTPVPSEVILREVAPILAEHTERAVREARADGVNEGIRLAAQMVRDHMLGDTGQRVADFLVGRADRGGRP